MADSENSRTLPAITRRNLLYAPAAFALPGVIPFASVAASTAETSVNELDPVLQLFRDWQVVHARYLKLSDLRWDAEVALFRKAKFPEVEIHLPDGRTFSAVTEEEITLGLALPSMSKTRARARADLAAMTDRWDEMDDEIGYSRAVEAENRAADRRTALAVSLLATPARSAEGAAAKLACFIEMNTPVAHYRKQLNPALRQFVKPSFPDLRAILADLVIIGGSSHGLLRT